MYAIICQWKALWHEKYEYCKINKKKTKVGQSICADVNRFVIAGLYVYSYLLQQLVFKLHILRQ